jgi:Uma2 family endonuclease
MTMPVSEQTYLQLIREDSDEIWELHCGHLRSKPPMTWEHVRTASVLGFRLQQQLELEAFVVIEQSGRAKRSESRYYVPDLVVVPDEMARQLFSSPGLLAVFPEPLPLVVEVWSPSTGTYDVNDKLPEYQRRGDLEIWLIHPYQRSLTSWVRQTDGSYAETVYREGVVRPAALPGVAIDLGELLTRVTGNREAGDDSQ